MVFDSTYVFSSSLLDLIILWNKFVFKQILKQSFDITIIQKVLAMVRPIALIMQLKFPMKYLLSYLELQWYWDTSGWYEAFPPIHIGSNLLIFDSPIHSYSVCDNNWFFYMPSLFLLPTFSRITTRYHTLSRKSTQNHTFSSIFCIFAKNES